jgi:hypothetical protein
VGLAELASTGRGQRTSAYLVFAAALCFVVIAILTGNPLAWVTVTLLVAGGTASLLSARQLGRG